jgi:hypothetical protein
MNTTTTTTTTNTNLSTNALDVRTQLYLLVDKMSIKLKSELDGALSKLLTISDEYDETNRIIMTLPCVKKLVGLTPVPALNISEALMNLMNYAEDEVLEEEEDEEEVDEEVLEEVLEEEVLEEVLEEDEVEEVLKEPVQNRVEMVIIEEVDEEEEEEEEDDDVSELEEVGEVEEEEEEVEGEGEGLQEVTIDGKLFYTTNTINGDIYGSDENGEPGEKVGVFVSGSPLFFGI